MKILNHQLDILHSLDKEWEKQINKMIFDYKKVYEYSYESKELFLIKIDNDFERKYIQTLDDSLFTIKNDKLFIIKNKFIKQQLLK